MTDQTIEWRNFGVPMAAPPPRLAPPTLPGLRVVGAIGAVIAAMLLCCLWSLELRAQRERLAALDAAIADADRDVAALRRQVAIRSRYAELDRWTVALRLAPPRADQFLTGEAALDRLAPRRARA